MLISLATSSVEILLLILIQIELSVWDKTFREYHSETAVGSATKLAAVSIMLIFLMETHFSLLKHCGFE